MRPISGMVYRTSRVYRMSAAPAGYLGVLYAAVATALIYGDISYWQAVIAGDVKRGAA